MKLFRLGTTVLALSTLTMLAAGDSMAATLGPAPPTTLAAASTLSSTTARQTVPTPAPSRPNLTVGLPDLTAGFFTFITHLDPGQEFGVPLGIRNEGNGPGRPVRVVFNADGFTDLRVTNAPGFTCTSEPPRAICRGEQVSVGQIVWLGVRANAPQTPGQYHMLVLVDPENAVEELNEQNNSEIQTFRVRSGQ